MYTDFIGYLSAQLQERLPLHVEGVISNDELFKVSDFKRAIYQKLYVTFALIE